MLEVRHIAGDADLSSLLIGGARRQWRTGIASRFDELVEHTEARWQRSGQIAHRAEPDLKCGRGGLRDVQLLNALAIAQLADVYPSRSLASPTGTLGEAHLALLNVRTELHRVAGRGRELLLAQHADEIGAALHIGDRFDLARTLSDAARTVSYYVDAGVRTAANALPRRGLAAFRRPVRRPLDEGVLEFAGEVILARDARPDRDPGLILRVAAASATTGLPIGASTLARLTETAPELRTPWPRQALKDLLVMLAAGAPAVAPGYPGQTCWCSVRYATTSARAAAGTTASSGPSWPPRSAPGLVCGRPMSNCCRRWCAITCCCRTPRRDATCRTPRPSRRWSTRSTATLSYWNCCRCWPRRIRLQRVPACGATGRRR
jgi:hypothetical protein